MKRQNEEMERQREEAREEAKQRAGNSDLIFKRLLERLNFEEVDSKARDMNDKSEVSEQADEQSNYTTTKKLPTDVSVTEGNNFDKEGNKSSEKEQSLPEASVQ